MREYLFRGLETQHNQYVFTDDGKDCWNHIKNECDWDSFIHFCNQRLVRWVE